MKPIQEYDLIKLEEAYELINKVFEYYFCVPGYKEVENRLGTILRKLDYLIERTKHENHH